MSEEVKAIIGKPLHTLTVKEARALMKEVVDTLIVALEPYKLFPCATRAMSHFLAEDPIGFFEVVIVDSEDKERTDTVNEKLAAIAKESKCS